METQLIHYFIDPVWVTTWPTTSNSCNMLKKDTVEKVQDFIIVPTSKWVIEIYLFFYDKLLHPFKCVFYKNKRYLIFLIILNY